ncbi:replication factor C large subunit [Methanobacterium spitsbergense]|uniref:Replication factor C large subunit n=1 Tax=Methanobacterium spitsbergense TaxID=2874285 RepID=A0A8T5UQN6_9EURY|nr:replication factor C large subunit [Methanobacterium spitsbergense]MBZ2166078.1 replication factor C large subunit [Methanobacterium spitsbergense]
MLWTGKYSPKNFDEVLGNVKIKDAIVEWTEEWLMGNTQNCLLLIGPAGTGKTTLAHLAANEFSEYIELNASDKRSYDIILNTIGEASASKSLFGDGLKLIILDEVDGIHGTEDRGGTRAISKIIKEGHHPLIMMANDPYSKRLKSLKTKCNTLILRKVHTNSIVALLKRICVKEGVEFEEHVIRNLAKSSNGDLRSAINDLEVIARGKTKITSEDLELLSKKDDIINIFDSVRTVLKSKNPRRIKDAMKVEAEPSFLIELIAENIPREYEKVDELQKAYEMISLADIYLGRAFNTRVYSYWKYTYELMSLGVALSKEETYRKFSRFTNSSIFAMLSKSRAKRDLKDKVAKKMGEKLHTSKKVVKEQFPYMEIMFQNDETAYELATYYGLADDEVKLFRSRKIKVKKSKTKKSVPKDSKPDSFNGFRSKSATKKSDSPAKKTEKSLNEENKVLKSENKKKDKKRNNKKLSDTKSSVKSEDKEKKSDKNGKDNSQTSLFNF